jgi:protein-S-isoprenylcysteine O-methyltransferase Ste14
VRLSLRALRLRSAWLMVVPFVLLARPTVPLLLVGGSVALLGTLLRGWAAGLIRKDRELSTDGPYAHTRNPLYLGSFLIGVGVALASGRWELVLLFGLFFAVLYAPLVRAEERALAQRFGDAYARWANGVPAFVPRLAPYRAEPRGEARFSFERWRRNREYQAVAGVLAGFVFLAARLLLDR